MTTRDDNNPDQPLTRDQGTSTGTHTGLVTRIVRDRGFGFIELTDGREYFMHKSSVGAIFAELKEGDQVTFEGWTTAKGLRATAVRR